MQTTKQQILVLLKRAGSVTVEEAAGTLAVASMTARQHLVGLERDGLVRVEKVRRANGRPHYLYVLTTKGEETFPRRYDLLAQIMLDEIGALHASEIEQLTVAEKQSLLVRRTADRLVERYRFQVEGRSLEERVAAVTDVLHLIGGFAEWLRTDEGFEIRDYNCVFSRLIPETQNGCEWHVHLLTQLLTWPVRHEHIDDGRVQCCRYLIEPDPANGRQPIGRANDMQSVGRRHDIQTAGRPNDIQTAGRLTDTQSVGRPTDTQSVGRPTDTQSVGRPL